MKFLTQRLTQAAHQEVLKDQANFKFQKSELARYEQLQKQTGDPEYLNAIKNGKDRLSQIAERWRDHYEQIQKVHKFFGEKILASNFGFNLKELDAWHHALGDQLFYEFRFHYHKVYRCGGQIPGRFSINGTGFTEAEALADMWERARNDHDFRATPHLGDISCEFFVAFPPEP